MINMLSVVVKECNLGREQELSPDDFVMRRKNLFKMTFSLKYFTTKKFVSYIAIDISLGDFSAK